MKPQVLLILIICLFTVKTCSSSGRVDIIPMEETVPVTENEKVQVSVYYETLCPYCQNFILNYLIDMFTEGIDAIADVKLFPYGNAQINSNGNITCQHGENECLFNTIESCAINTWPDVHVHFPFVFCAEKYLYYRKFDKVESCYEELRLDPTPVKECYNSGYGNQLELQYAHATTSLKPPRQYVPWVVVDGKPLYGDYMNIVNETCSVYKGPTLPKACQASPKNHVGSVDKVIPINQVTYPED